MHYRPDEEKYTQILTKFTDKENPPKNILLFEIRNKKVMENFMDMFPTTNFYFIDEPYFLNILTDARYRGGKYFSRIKCFEKVETKIPTPPAETEKLLKGLESILKRIEGKELTVIMNPPYGKASSISRRVVNYILEHCTKISELICLAPIKSNYGHWTDLKEILGPYSLSKLFNITKSNDMDLYISHYINSQKGTFQKTLSETLLSKKQHDWYKAVQVYNKTHSSTFIEILGLTLKSKERCKTYDENFIFEIPIYAPWTGFVRTGGETGDHNIKKLPIQWREGNSTGPYGLFCNSSVEFDNFSHWYYAHPYDKNKNSCVMNISLAILNTLYGADPSILKYKEVWPNLDWTRPWTDEEIIQELKDKAGLPQDWKLD